MSLSSCPACARHVRRSERICPFCRSAISFEGTPPPRGRGRLGRMATFAFGAAVSTNLVGCPTTSSMDAGDDEPDVRDLRDAPVYGGPDTPSDTPFMAADTGEPDDDAGVVDAGTGNDAGVDAGGIAPAYGAPPK